MFPIIAVFGLFGIGCLVYAFTGGSKPDGEKQSFTYNRFRFMMAGFGFVLLAILLFWMSSGHQ